MDLLHSPMVVVLAQHLHRLLRIAVLVPALVAAGCGGQSTEQLLASARTYLDKGDNAAAIIQLKNALQKDLKLAEARYLLGEALLRSGNPGDAALELRRAVEYGYAADKAVPALARALAAQGQSQVVVRDYANTRFDNPEATASLKTSLALAYLAEKSPAQADKALAEALQAVPEHPPALLLKARMMGTAGQRAEALAIVDRVVAAHPKDADAFFTRGNLLQLDGKRSDALAAYNTALELQPTHGPARIAKISLMFELGETAAASEIDKLRRLPGQQQQSLFFEAQAAITRGDDSRAYELIQQVLKAAPNHALSLQVAGGLELKRGRLLVAERTLTKALQISPELPVARRLLAQTYVRSGQPAKALSTLSPMLEGARPDADALLIAGEASLLGNEVDKAEQLFRKAVAAAPDQPRSRTALAALQLQRTQSEAALNELKSIAAEDKTGSQTDMVVISYYVRRGELPRALEAIDRLEAKQPRNPLAPQLRGGVQLRQNDVAGARASFEKALGLDPVYMPAVTRLVELDLRDKQVDTARQRLEKVLATDKRNLQALLGLAALQTRQMAPPEKIEALLREAVAGNPSDVQPRLALVEHLLAHRQAPQALEAAQAALVAQPESIELLDALGRAQTATGDTQQAVSTFNKLVALAPQSSLPYARLADLELAAKNTAAAKAHLQRAVAIAPDLVPAQQALLRIALSENRTQDALAIARAVQKARPQDLTGFLWEADLDASKGGNAAVDRYKALYARFPQPEAAIRLHRALMRADRQPEAEKVAAAWVAAHPQERDLRYYLGEQAMMGGDFARAVAQFQAVLQHHPNYVPALNNMAWAMVRLGDKGALVPARRATELQPDVPALLDTLALALAQDKQFDEAVKVQKRVLELAPDEPNGRMTLARIYLQAGKSAQARTELQTLAALGDKFPAQPEVQKLLSQL